jgi:uncharacterized caspase-like protein
MYDHQDIEGISRRLRVFLLFMAVAPQLFLALPAFAAKGGQAVSIKDKAGKQVVLYRESHALVIGVSFYTSGWPPLSGVRADVKAVTKALEKQGFDVTVVENPNKQELETALENFILTYGLNPGNRLIIYFAGHGYTHKPSYAADDPEEWIGYIVARDAPRPSSDLSDFFRHAISMQQVANLALQIESKHVLFMFDSCFSGSVFSLSRAVPQDIQERTAKPVRQFITSGSADQEVPDQSIFRRQLIEALEGEADLNEDGFVTGSELGLFLEEKVTNYSRRAQTPQYGKIRHHRLDKGDFVFVLPTSGEAEEAPEDPELERLAREEFERKRLVLEEQRKKLEAERRLLEERRKLAEEKERVAEEMLKEVERKREEKPAKRKDKEEAVHLAYAPVQAPPAGPEEGPPGVAISKLPSDSPESLGRQIKVTRFLSAQLAKEYLEELEWDRYEVYRALITQSDDPFSTRRDEIPLTDEPALVLVLRQDPWTVVFQGQQLGSGKVQPVEGEVRDTTLTMLERHLPLAYRARVVGGDVLDLAIVLVPQPTRLKAVTRGNTIRMKVIGPESTPFRDFVVRFVR